MGIFSLLTNGDHKKFKATIKEDTVTKPKVSFEPGEMVRVVDGPFNDFSGVVEEVNYEKSKVRVAVLIFGRSTPVELQFNQIEKG